MNEINIKRLESRLINSSLQIGKFNYKNLDNKDFGQVLENIKRKNESILFSKHALERMDKRNIQLTTEELDRLERALIKQKIKV